MTNKTYDLPAIVAQVRSAGNPRMAVAAALILGWFARMVTLARIIHTEVHDYGV